MNPEVKKLWTDTLRSGEFQQTVAALYRTEPLAVLTEGDDRPAGMCCLGVLCELHRRQTGNGKWVAADTVGLRQYVIGNPDDEFCPYYSEVSLPYPVQMWAGVKEEDPSFATREDGELEVTTLAKLNDTGKTFEEIANVIEEKL